MEGIKTERVTARNGDLCLRRNGRWLASSVDPRREARSWLDSYRSTLGQCDRAMVVGIGSGYHLLALTEEFPQTRVMALTLEADLIDAVRDLHGLALTRVEFHACESESVVLNSARVRTFLRGNVEVMNHLTSQTENPLAYAEIFARLKMREPLFFSDWVRRDERFANLFPLQTIPGGDTRQLLSIKDLDRLLNPKVGAQNNDVLLIRALRELVR